MVIIIVDGFEEIFNIVYVAKKLHDMGKYEPVTENFFDVLEPDAYYENMYGLIPNLFAHYYCLYSEEQCVELHVLSDPVIVDFYILAGKYGRHNNIPDENNPYIKAAGQETGKNLNFSYCLDWQLMGHTDPKRPFHSRLGLFIGQENYVDIGYPAYRLIELYEWFADKCVELSDILHEDAPGQLILESGLKAA